MGITLRVIPQHLTRIVGAPVFMVPVGRAQPLTAVVPDSVRARALREPPPPWAPPPRVKSEFCQICHIFVTFVFKVHSDYLQLTQLLLFAFLVHPAFLTIVLITGGRAQLCCWSVQQQLRSRHLYGLPIQLWHWHRNGLNCMSGRCWVYRTKRCHAVCMLGKHIQRCLWLCSLRSLSIQLWYWR